MKTQLLQFDPRILLGDRLGIIFYIYCAQSILNGDSEQALYLYKKFISYFHGEVNEHTPENFKKLISSIKENGFNPYYPVEANPKEHFLFNGAHRVATAIALKITEIPYSLVFRDNRTNTSLFPKIFTHTELAFLKDYQEKIIKSLPEPLQLMCKARRFMREYEKSFHAPFSSKNSVGALRLYQADDELGLSGKRNTRLRWSIYGLEGFLSGSEEALEVGCNIGLLSKKIAQHVSHLDAFDVDEKYINLAKLIAKHTGCNNIQFFSGRLPGINLEKRYDLIISCAVHGWANMNFAEYCRFLFDHIKTNGLILIESHEILHENDWAKKKAFLARFGDILASGFIDDVDHTIYQSEIREYLLLRPKEISDNILTEDFVVKSSSKLKQSRSEIIRRKFKGICKAIIRIKLKL